MFGAVVALELRERLRVVVWVGEGHQERDEGDSRHEHEERGGDDPGRAAAEQAHENGKRHHTDDEGARRSIDRLAVLCGFERLLLFGKTGFEFFVFAHDEVDLAAGDVRSRFGGGLNAHNGLRSLKDKLGTADFWRVRSGIGRPPGKMDVATYVLRECKGDMLDELLATASRAADEAYSLLVG